MGALSFRKRYISLDINFAERKAFRGWLLGERPPAYPEMANWKRKKVSKPVFDDDIPIVRAGRIKIQVIENPLD